MNLEELASYDLKDEDREFTDKKIKRIRFKNLKSLGKKYNIVIHISGSPARTDVFKKFIKRLIPINNRTKWNS
jgi:hypothetical protein